MGSYCHLWVFGESLLVISCYEVMDGNFIYYWNFLIHWFIVMEWHYAFLY
jgi:hypothetical protein